MKIRFKGAFKGKAQANKRKQPGTLQGNGMAAIPKMIDAQKEQ